MSESRRQLMTSRANQLRDNMTWAEKKLWHSFLRDYPVHFVAQKVMGNYILDFYCRKAKLSIEIDGDSHFESRQIKYDQTRTTYLEMLEIKELRFTNSEIGYEFEGVCDIIHSEVQKRRNDVHDDSTFQRLLCKR